MAENEKDSKYELFSLMPTLYCRLSLFIPPSLSHTLSLSLSIYIYIYLYMYVLCLYIFVHVCMQAFQWIFWAQGDKSPVQRGFNYSAGDLLPANPERAV